MFSFPRGKSFTKAGSGRRHFGTHCAGYTQRNDKKGTTKLSRTLAKKAIYPPQKKHPFSNTK